MGLGPNDKIVRGADLTVIGQRIKALLTQYLTERLGDARYHPKRGDAELDFIAGVIEAASLAASGGVSSGTSVSSGGTVTVGSGHTGGTEEAESYRTINFGSMNQYIRLVNINAGTELEPSWAFEFSAPYYSVETGTPTGSSTVPNIPHVLLSMAEFEALDEPDNGTVYLIYEDEE